VFSPLRARAQAVSFEEARNFAAGNAPGSVAVGDFNGDGQLDLAGNLNSDSVSVLIKHYPPVVFACLSPRARPIPFKKI